MGTTSSHHHSMDSHMAMEHQPIYPDMNVIFKGIPKMMQVADDMRTLSNAVVDMRNLTYALSFMMLLGMCMFLVLKCLQTRRGKTRRRRRLQNHTDSEQSSLNRPYRQYTQKPLDWNHHQQTKIDMEKLLEHSSSSHGSQHTPPSITPKHIPDFHVVERTPPPLQTTTPLNTQNGGIKRLDPIKLMIDEVPYADN
ncbi:hypothetical protein M3Y97_00227100 [Aphelenchoides bicaudatus]|nr:hypothetical protein M3Y97_00227100 [Aphelenchoides bicaudatus]